MGKLLWRPSAARRAGANITAFIDFVNRRHALKIAASPELYAWSIANVTDFWAAVWEFTGIRASRGYDAVIEDNTKFPGAKWFPGARLNFAENLLRYRDDGLAFIFRGETEQTARLTYTALYTAVARLAKALRDMGLVPGDRVAAYMPNLPKTAIAMLASASIGAVWASCATDLGAQAALDRLGQIEPKVLFTVDGYFYKGKAFSAIPNATEIAAGIPSLEKVVVARYTAAAEDIGGIPQAIYYDDFLAADDAPEIEFAQLPFDHPIYIMFSSGTTGVPKCLVQGAGGILINHLKELVLHTDLRREDRIFYITTCSWMMWNWLLSALGVGATVVLFDGNPAHPDAGAIWRLLEEELVSVFGTSASYINFLKAEGMQPGRDFDLSALRAILQTGSVLSAEGFEYVYRAIKSDVHFNSIAGGTDINGCFAVGDPTLPVYAGELQSWGLGMKMACYDEAGQAVTDRMGELVCESPVPSMPLYFWHDADGAKYQSAYFDVYPGVWRHGDFVLRHSDTGGITFFGRSDALLKPSGVRIGTAEIYNQVEKMPQIADSLAIGQSWRDDERIILFVKLAEGQILTDELEVQIRKTLRIKASPRHVPARIIEVPDIPYTLNLKKVEIAVTNIIKGLPVSNRDALANPESLDYYLDLVGELQKE